MRYVSKEKLNKMALFDADGEQVAVVSGDDIEAARADVADCLWLAHGQKVSCPLHGVRKSGFTKEEK